MASISIILKYLISFSIFALLQSLCINGIYYCFGGNCTNDIQKGMVCVGNVFFLLAPEFFTKHKGEKWTLPLWGCIRCMSSVWGIITFLPLSVYLFGFHLVEIPIAIFDILILCTLNYIIYKLL